MKSFISFTVPPDQYAYGVWVSEIMSQQTQIERVATYWRRWIDRWPDAVSLSNATQEEVNEMWAGLGYYRRAR
jgi:A/G-specific adenine glycosylase